MSEAASKPVSDLSGRRNVRSVILSPLSRPLPKLTRSTRPLNLFELLGVARSEGTADLVLAYFLDPSERHGLGTLPLDSLLTTFDGAPLIGPDGRGAETFDASAARASTDWVVQRQVRVPSVSDNPADLGWTGIIDLYITHEALGVAIVIENKIDAVLNNPFASYARYAIEGGHKSVVLVVLAPFEHRLSGEESRWASRAVTYPAWLAEVEAGLTALTATDESTSTEDARRSLEILTQFIEVRRDATMTQDITAEARYIDEFRAARNANSQQIDEILDAVQEVNKLTKARSKRLEPLVGERLVAAGLSTGWEAHGASSERWPLAWNAYHFEDADISVELLMSQNPRFESPIFVKAYPGRSYKLFGDVDNVPLGTTWEQTDDEIADAFVARVTDILRSH